MMGSVVSCVGFDRFTPQTSATADLDARLGRAVAVQDILNYVTHMTPLATDSIDPSASQGAAPERSDACERVEQGLRTAIAGDGLLGAAAAHLTNASSAKRARPRLLMAFTRLAGGSVEDERVVHAAVAVELLHTASLMHDDVIDEANERRTQPSTNARFGNSAAVLAGDVVLTRALALLAFDARATQAAIEAVTRMSAAAVREIEVRRQLDVTIADALAIAFGKTGALFGLCGRLAVVGNERAPPAVASALEAAGRAFGVAFQVADDISDLEQDVREGTPTAPLLLAASDPVVRRELMVAWSSGAPDEARASAAALARAHLDAEEAWGLVQAQLERARAVLTPLLGAPGYDEVMRSFAPTVARARRAT
jgi:geranylgeranyl pyrophosphate synthase